MKATNKRIKKILALTLCLSMIFVSTIFALCSVRRGRNPPSDGASENFESEMLCYANKQKQLFSIR